MHIIHLYSRYILQITLFSNTSIPFERIESSLQFSQNQNFIMELIYRYKFLNKFQVLQAINSLILFYFPFYFFVIDYILKEGS